MSAFFMLSVISSRPTKLTQTSMRLNEKESCTPLNNGNKTEYENIKYESTRYASLQNHLTNKESSKMVVLIIIPFVNTPEVQYHNDKTPPPYLALIGLSHYSFILNPQTSDLPSICPVPSGLRGKGEISHISHISYVILLHFITLIIQ
jgi:hypothetical protein